MRRFTFITTALDPPNVDIASALWGVGSSQLSVGNNRFGPCIGGHLTASGGGVFITVNGPLTILAGSHFGNMRADAGGIIALNPVNHPVLTLIGTPNWTNCFAVAGDLSVIRGVYQSITGGATGTRYNCYSNSIINTNGAGVNYYPGNVAGQAVQGGQYI